MSESGAGARDFQDQLREILRGYVASQYEAQVAALLAAVLEARATASAVCPVVEAVRADMARRAEVGLRKYGVTLADNEAPLIARLQHLYEELMDGAAYIRWAMDELRALQLAEEDLAALREGRAMVVALEPTEIMALAGAAALHPPIMGGPPVASIKAARAVWRAMLSMSRVAANA